MIATVYKPSRRKDGKRIVGRMYRGRYRLDPKERLKDVPLQTNDRRIAEQKLGKILQEEQRDRDGIRTPKYQRIAASTPVLTHIMDYIADRRGVGRDEKYVCELDKKLQKLAVECGWQRIADITSELFCTWRAKTRKSAKTLNEYLNAISGLMNCPEPRIGANPMRHVQKVREDQEKVAD